MKYCEIFTDEIIIYVLYKYLFHLIVSPPRYQKAVTAEGRRGCHQEIPQTGTHEAWRKKKRNVEADVGTPGERNMYNYYILLYYHVIYI